MSIVRLSILGVGLLGGSLGLAAKRSMPGVRVVGYGHRPVTLESALKLGAIDEATADVVSAVHDADLVVLCTPVGLFDGLLGQIAPALKRGAIVTDVGSTKRSVVERGESLVARFVGSHPMAGSEKRGVEFARADLFDRALCILTPTPRTDPAALDLVDTFWKKIGSRTTHLAPDTHDELLAGVSHLPHLLAAALVAVQDERAMDLAGRGFLDTTRVASGDGGLWRDILLDNRDHVRASIDRLKTELDTLSKHLDAQDTTAVKAWLDHAAARRDDLARRSRG